MGPQYPAPGNPPRTGRDTALWFTESHHAGALIPAVTLAALRGWPPLSGDLTERPLVADRPTGVERLIADRVPRLL